MVVLRGYEGVYDWMSPEGCPPLVKGQPPLIVIKVVTLIIDPVRLVVKVVTSIIGKVKKNSKSRGSPQRCLWRVIAHPFRGMVGVCNNLWKPPLER